MDMSNGAPVTLNRKTIDLITGRLHDFGYPGVTTDHVIAQLRKPESDRDVIGLFAAEMLTNAGVLTWEIED